MKRSVFVLTFLLSWCAAVITGQFQPRPYDRARARHVADEMLRTIDDICGGAVHNGDDGTGLSSGTQFLVESLSAVTPSTAIDPVVFEALALTAQGAAESTLLKFGAHALPALIKTAMSQESCLDRRKGAMDTIEQMLEQPAIERTLPADSKSRIRSLARSCLQDMTLTGMEVGSAGYLAIATRDPKLRAVASQLLRHDELRRRGLDPAYDAWTIEVIGQALVKFPPRQARSNPRILKSRDSQILRSSDPQIYLRFLLKNAM